MTNSAKSCADHTPPGFVGHWREWHRGHGCDKDDGKPRSEAAKTEVAQIAENADTGFLTDAELSFLRAATTSGDTLRVRALDELAARRQGLRTLVADLRDADPGLFHPDPDKREIARTCREYIASYLERRIKKPPPTHRSLSIEDREALARLRTQLAWRMLDVESAREACIPILDRLLNEGESP